MTENTEPATADRRRALRRGMWLNGILIVWNIAEGIIGVIAGLLAGSVALLGFSIDSGIEVLSAVIVWWRLRAELHGTTDDGAAELEERAERIAGGLLLLLAAYLVIDAGRRLLGAGPEAGESPVGIALTAVSLVVMPVLGWMKLRTSQELGSGALRADAFETITCAWLSLTTLIGLSLNATLGWSGADPVAALIIVPLIVREGLEAFGGDDDD
ncbi:cation transporter [Maioricimonas sp. JC845]|uniref:cation transporter n=1 Tax=Maioricimonas sp. JC845 TaxID=3232138 RepID=UPI003459EF77